MRKLRKYTRKEEREKNKDKPKEKKFVTYSKSFSKKPIHYCIDVSN